MPANRIGFGKGMTGFQLKMTQEVIIVVVFALFAVFYPNEQFQWKYPVSFAFLLLAVIFIFTKKY